MKFMLGLFLGILLTVGGVLMAQNEREMHPRIARAIEALRDAREYMAHAPHDFGGHKVEAMRTVHEAIEQLRQAEGCAKCRD